MKTHSGLHTRNTGRYALLTALTLAEIMVPVGAQGTLSLNTATGPKHRISLDGRNVQPEDNVFVQVLVAGASSLTGVGAEPFRLILTGANAGLFAKGTLTVIGKDPFSPVDVTIRAWDKDSGETYDIATVRASTILKDFYLGWDGRNIAFLPPSIGDVFPGLELRTFSNAPEPSTYVLAGVGLGGLFLLRRR